MLLIRQNINFKEFVSPMNYRGRQGDQIRQFIGMDLHKVRVGLIIY
jgi:hypothetical protein